MVDVCFHYGYEVGREKEKRPTKRTEKRVAILMVARKCNDVIVRNCHTAANLKPPNHANVLLVKRTSNCRGCIEVGGAIVVTLMSCGMHV
jgi:hypothetical protein